MHSPSFIPSTKLPSPRRTHPVARALPSARTLSAKHCLFCSTEYTDTNQAKLTRQHPPDAVSRPYPILLLPVRNTEGMVVSPCDQEEYSARNGLGCGAQDLRAAQKLDSEWNMQYGHGISETSHVDLAPARIRIVGPGVEGETGSSSGVRTDRGKPWPCSSRSWTCAEWYAWYVVCCKVSDTSYSIGRVGGLQEYHR